MRICTLMLKNLGYAYMSTKEMNLHTDIWTDGHPNRDPDIVLPYWL